MTPKTEERIKEIMPLLPIVPPAGIVEEAEARGYLHGEALVFRMEWRPGKNGKKERKVRLMCSCCKGDTFCDYVSLLPEDTGRACGYSYGWQGTYGFTLNESDGHVYRHNSTCVCPLCGYGGTAYLASKIPHGTPIDSVLMVSAHAFDGVLALLEWHLAKNIGKDGKTFTCVNGTDGVLVLERMMVRVRKYDRFFTSYRMLQNWEYKKTFSIDIGSVGEGRYIGLDRELLEKTAAANSGLCDYVKGGGKKPIEFLRTWQKYRQLENLAVQGYAKLVDYALDKYAYSVLDINNYFNMKFKSPDKMLGIDKTERWVARRCNWNELKYYKEVRDGLGIRLDRELMDVSKRAGMPSILSILEEKYGKTPLVQLLHYLDRQEKDAGYLRDYWEMCIRLYKRVPPELKFPKDLGKAHDDLTTQIKWQAEQALIAGFEEAKEKFARYAWSDEELGLCIRICHNQKEMIAEGKALHHCVARYAESHSRGETAIMFIRHIATPDVPFFTLELKNGKVVQNHGKSNCGRTPEVKEFETRWLAHIKKLEKEGKLNGKRSSRNQEKLRAGA